MPTKKKRVSTKKPQASKGPTRRTEAEYLEVLIAASERANTGHGNGVDQFFTEQAARLRGKLEALKASKKD